MSFAWSSTARRIPPPPVLYERTRLDCVRIGPAPIDAVASLRAQDETVAEAVGG